MAASDYTLGLTVGVEPVSKGFNPLWTTSDPPYVESDGESEAWVPRCDQRVAVSHHAAMVTLIQTEHVASNNLLNHVMSIMLCGNACDKVCR